MLQTPLFQFFSQSMAIGAYYLLFAYKVFYDTAEGSYVVPQTKLGFAMLQFKCLSHYVISQTQDFNKNKIEIKCIYIIVDII